MHKCSQCSQYQTLGDHCTLKALTKCSWMTIINPNVHKCSQSQTFGNHASFAVLAKYIGLNNNEPSDLKKRWHYLKQTKYLCAQM